MIITYYYNCYLHMDTIYYILLHIDTIGYSYYTLLHIITHITCFTDTYRYN
jgi:hypothetical protein